MQRPDQYPKASALTYRNAHWQWTKTKAGASIAHSGNNRAERNRIRYLLRTGYQSRDTGKMIPGQRSQRRKELRIQERNNGRNRPIIIRG